MLVFFPLSIQYILGDVPELKWKKKAGTIHQARWMAAIIYILKMIFVGQRFHLSAAQRQGVIDLAFFIVYIYGFYWFSCPVPADAPFLTLSLWKDVKQWEVRDKFLSRECLRKLDGHTWYLGQAMVVLAFWSLKVDADVKMKMAQVLLSSPKTSFPVGFKPDLPRVYEDSELPEFVGSSSWLLFEVSN